MYAIIEIAGQQFKVEKDRSIYTHRLVGEEGAVLVVDKVLLVDNGGVVSIGTPHLANATVTAKIVSHLRGEKVLVFKKKRRKTYQKMNGHRQNFTKVLIEGITI